MQRDLLRPNRHSFRLVTSDDAGPSHIVAGNAEALADPEACFQVARLEELAMTLLPGADAREEAYRIARHPYVRSWLDASERALERTATTIAFRNRRRRGILRILAGAAAGFPLSFPFGAIVPAGIAVMVGQLEDELEYYPLLVHEPTRMRPYPLPVKSILNSTDARAYLGWKWYRLEKFLRRNPHIPTGRFSPDGSGGITFDAAQFAKWAWSQSA